MLVAGGYLLGVLGDPLVQKPILDLKQYADLAASMAAGDLPSGAFFVDPLYLLIRAILMAAFGEGIGPPLVLNLCAFAASALLFRRVVTRMADARVALIAAILLPLCAPLLFFQAFPMKETLALSLMLGAILSFFRWRDGEGSKALSLAGALMGLAVLCRGNLLIILPVFVLSSWFSSGTHTSRVRAVALFLCCFAIPILPVTAWNYHASGAVVPITYNMGNNLYQGNNPDHQSTDFYNPVFIRDNPDFEELDWRREMASRLSSRCPECPRIAPEKILPSELSAFWRSEALSFIAQEPFAFVRRSFAKLARLLSDSEITNNVPMDYMEPRSWVLRFGTYGFGSLVFLGIPAWILAIRRLRYGLELSAMGLLYAFGVSGFYVLSRLKLPLIPVLLVPLSWLVCALWDRFRDREGMKLSVAEVRIPVFLAFVALFLSGIMAFWPHEDREGMGEYNLGVVMLDQGDWSAAESAFKEALDKNPDFAPNRVNLARALVNRGEVERALQILSALTTARPDYARAWSMLGEVCIRAGRLDDAERALSSALELVPENPADLVNLGMVLARTGREAKALPFFETAWRIEPEPQTGSALLTALLNLGDNERALRVSSAALRRFPDSSSIRDLHRLAMERSK